METKITPKFVARTNPKFVARTNFVIHVAVSDDGFIGREGKLPWKIPSDLAWFRQHTIGRPVIMGRRTFESMGGRPLDRRINIVLTHQTNMEVQDNPLFPMTGVIVAGDIGFAKITSRIAASDLNSDEIAVIGGETIYKEFLPSVDRIYMTIVHATVNGDTKFPDLHIQEWSSTVVKSREQMNVEYPDDQFETTRIVYDRVGV